MPEAESTYFLQIFFISWPASPLLRGVTVQGRVYNILSSTSFTNKTETESSKRVKVGRRELPTRGIKRFLCVHGIHVRGSIITRIKWHESWKLTLFNWLKGVTYYVCQLNLECSIKEGNGKNSVPFHLCLQTCKILFFKNTIAPLNKVF